MDAEQVPWYPAILTFVQLAIYVSFGCLRDVAGIISGISRYRHERKTPPGLAKLLSYRESFFIHRMYHRIQDVFNRPVTGTPGAHINLVKRESPDGNVTLCGRLDEHLQSDVFQTVDQFSLACSVPAMEFGTTSLHTELEKSVAKFVGKEAAIVYNTGYATNSTSIPALMGRGTLILSDTLNRTSIVSGSRTSGATVGVFKHNDPEHLAKVLRTKIAEGQPRTGRAWKKVWVLVEEIYSMEGEILRLREIVDVVKKYKAYIYVDEAHSIGAIGETGRGICEYSGVDPSDIDILMGTLSKSFGGMGGYVAASKEIIAFIRCSSSGSIYDTGLSPVIVQQVLTALKMVAGWACTDIGRKKVASLRENSNYFRQKLLDMGVVALGDFDSPVIPVMLYVLSKIADYSRACLRRNLAIVSVAFPATPFLLSRVRFCISAAHTKEDLDESLQTIKELSEEYRIRYSSHTCG